MKFLFATTNKAKIKYYGMKLKEYGIDLVTLNDLNIDIDVDENGDNPVENAIIKAMTYNKISGLPTVALDDGLYFDDIPSCLQPGTHVRRINGKKLSDKEMINYYTDLVNKYGDNGFLKGYFLKGVAVVYNSNIYDYSCKIYRDFSSKHSEIIDDGYPLASLVMIKSLNKFKSELSKEEEKLIKDNEQTNIIEFIIDTLKMIENDSKSTH